MDDEISQGREPERDPRSALPRRWRVAGTLIVVVAGLAVAGIGLRHAADAAGTSRPPAGTAPVPFAASVPPSAAAIPAPPVPGNDAAIVACAPSTGACWMRLNVRESQGTPTVAPTP